MRERSAAGNARIPGGPGSESVVASYSPAALIDVTSDSVPVTEDDRGYAIDATAATVRRKAM
jgi:hypothetical protein